jgi:hypothetical protein
MFYKGFFQYLQDILRDILHPVMVRFENSAAASLAQKNRGRS